MATATFEPFDEVVESQTRNVFHTLNEKDKRRFAAIQARQLGRGGITYISNLLDISESKICRGIDELDTLPNDPAEGRVRWPGAGLKKSDAGIVCRSESTVAHRNANGRGPR
jgi:hypothetical protein